MNQEKNIQKISKENKIDKVGETNIHPVSEMENKISENKKSDIPQLSKTLIH